MCLERPHAELGGQREGLPVVLFGLFGAHGVGVGVDFAEEAERPGAGPPVPLFEGEIEGLLRMVGRIFDSPGLHTGLAKPGDKNRAPGRNAPGGSRSHSFFQ